jgi:hypothetical protein
MSNLSAQIGAQGSAWTNVAAGSAITGRITDSYPYTGGYNGMIVFRGMVEVEKAANGFVVRLGTRQGDVATTYVAKDVAEVNGIITAEMVKFRLEDK